MARWHGSINECEALHGLETRSLDMFHGKCVTEQRTLHYTAAVSRWAYLYDAGLRYDSACTSLCVRV